MTGSITSGLAAVLCAMVLVLGPASRADDSAGQNAGWIRTAQDDQGNIHMVTGFTWGACYYSKFSNGSWSSPVQLPNSNPCWFNFTNPDIDVGPDGKPQVVYGIFTGDYPNDLEYVFYAKANDVNGTSWSVTTIGGDGYRRNHARIAVDENNVAHITYMKTNKYQPWWWQIIYRRPDGSEKIIQGTSPESYRCNNPDIAYKDGIVHIAWYEGGSGTMTTNIMHSAGAPYSDFPIFEQLTDMPYRWFVGDPGIAISPDGQVDIVYIVADYNSDPGIYKGVYSTRTGLVDGGWATVDEEQEDWGPNIAYLSNGTRYVVWSHHHNGETMYVRNSEPKQTLTPWGNIDICTGVSGAWYVRTYGSPGGVWYEFLENDQPQFYPPTAAIDSIVPSSVTRGIDTIVHFFGSGFDNDESGASITGYEWSSNLDGILGSVEDLDLAPIALQPGRHLVGLKVLDDEGVWSDIDHVSLNVLPDPLPPPAVDSLWVRRGFVESLIVQWSPVVDNLAMDHYELYRGTTAWFEPGTPLTEIDQVPLTYVDATPFGADSVAVYTVIAVDVDGNHSDQGARAGAYRFTLEDGQ